VKINHEFKNVVVSHKALIEADIEIQKKEIIGQLQKEVLEGVVKTLLLMVSLLRWS
jgi:small subunit ribosomal protein S1